MFLRENYLDTKIKKISTSIIVKEIKNKRYKVNKYIKIKIYLSNKNNLITLIKWEFYIIDNLTTKALININIMKLKDIIIDL